MDIVLVVTKKDEDRLAEAVSSFLSLQDDNGVPRPARPAEIKAHLVKYIKSLVAQEELRTAAKAVVIKPIEVN